VRDRIEEADQAFFERVRRGYQAIAEAEPDRVHIINATGSIEVVAERIWKLVEKQLLPRNGAR